jgi:hypothetical protein
MTYKNISSNYRKLNMLFSDNSLTPEAENMLLDFFNNYSTDGLMS